jgi:hypothetical protein
MSTAVADADDLEDEAPRQPTRRDGRIIAVPNAPIPPELNAEFLDALAVERALSVACGLASGNQRVHRAGPLAAFRRLGVE